MTAVFLEAGTKLTGSGPSSNELANTPVGASQTSPGILHLYAVVEQTSWLPASSPWGYTLGAELGGIFGILPAATAAFRASTQELGSWDVRDAAEGNPLDHSKVINHEQSGGL
jgi:hypothetical protein